MSILYKTPNEFRSYSFDFSAEPEIVAGDTIVSVVSGPVVTPSGLTIGSNSISSPVVSFNVSGGTAGIKYTFRIRIQTSSGATIDGTGTLVVIDQKG